MLSAAQLNATASVPGDFAYIPAVGEMLAVGTHTLSATFVPENAADYAAVKATVPLTVTKAMPTIAPPMPAPEKAPAEAPAKPMVKAAQKEAPATPLVEAPAKNLAKTPTSKFEFDAESGLDLMGTAVFPDGTTIYLVMQPGSAGQLDSSRLVSQFFTTGDPKPEIVIKRYGARTLGVGEDETPAALAKPASSPISRPIEQMDEADSDQSTIQDMKKGFSLNILKGGIFGKISSTEKEEESTQPGLTPGQDHADAALAATRPETRMYKGAVYEKGADGQWHLQQLPARAVKTETPAIASPTPAPPAHVAKPKPAAAAPAQAAKPAPPAAPAPQMAAAKAAPAQAAKPAPPAAPAPQKVAAKVVVKPAVKAKSAAKPAVKAKVPVKPAVKAKAKAAAKPPVKAKVPVKPAVKAKAKAAAKPPAKATKPTAKKAAVKPAKPAKKR
jgi:hypothetical protein